MIFGQCRREITFESKTGDVQSLEVAREGTSVFSTDAGLNSEPVSGDWRLNFDGKLTGYSLTMLLVSWTLACYLALLSITLIWHSVGYWFVHFDPKTEAGHSLLCPCQRIKWNRNKSGHHALSTSWNTHPKTAITAVCGEIGFKGWLNSSFGYWVIRSKATAAMANF